MKAIRKVTLCVLSFVVMFMMMTDTFDKKNGHFLFRMSIYKEKFSFLTSGSVWLFYNDATNCSVTE